MIKGFVETVGLSLVWFLIAAALAFAQQPTCEENRDMLLVEYGQVTSSVGRLSLENRQLKAKVAELEKELAKYKAGEGTAKGEGEGKK